MKIGLSLSMCVKDILEGNVALEDVSKIITGTKFSTMEDAIKEYSKLIWYRYPQQDVVRVVTALWPVVYQPRLEGKDIPKHNSSNYWVTSEDEIRYKF
jgi:hypothetical protein